MRTRKNSKGSRGKKDIRKGKVTVLKCDLKSKEERLKCEKHHKNERIGNRCESKYWIKIQKHIMRN